MALAYLPGAGPGPGEADRSNAKYRRKYRDIKRRLAALVIENAALCDEVAKVQESIVIVKEERRFLMRKLLEYENDADSRNSKSMSPGVHITNGSKSKK